MNGNSSPSTSAGAPSSGASSTLAAPTLTLASNALHVDGGGAPVALPISVSQGHHVSVTISGLASYESVTDALDHQTFTGNSITLTAAQVNSGLSLSSSYSGPDQPVNTLSITASDTVGHNTVTSDAQSIVVTDPAVTPSGSTTAPVAGAVTAPATSTTGSNPLTLQVSGDMLGATDPQIQVFVDGHQVGNSSYSITAHHSQGQTQTIEIDGNFDPTVAHQVQVKLINDNWDGTAATDGHDINVYVSSISLNGATLNGAQGTNAATNNLVHSANANDAVMDINGALAFNVPADPPAAGGTSTGSGSTGNTGSGSTGGDGGGSGTGSNPLTLQVSGDMFNGDPQIQVFVDGQQVGAASYDITAHHSQGQTQTITIAGDFDPTVAHQVQVKFVNDSWDGTSAADGHDRNVYVSSVSLSGTTLNGTQSTGADASSGTAALMHSNGTFTFNMPADPPAGGNGNGSSGGGTSGTGAGAPPSGPGFYVSTTGSDSNAGTQDSPFATLARAQQAMENSSIKTTYIEGGTYHIGSTINLGAADNGETWAYYAPDGVNSAVLDGGRTVNLFNISGASNVTIDGLKMQNVNDYAINSGGALSDNITIENCDVGFNNHTGLAGGFNPIIGLGNVTNAHVLNNYVHDTASQGIALYAWNAGDTLEGSVVSGNVVLNAVQQMGDGGAIYLDMRFSNVNGGHVTISNNYVKDYGSSAAPDATGIYLDDDSSNVTITGNVIGPANAGAGGRTEAVLFNGGSANVVTNNIIDLGDGKTVVNAEGPGGTGGTLAYGNPPAPNSITGNIIISNYAGGNPAHSFDEAGHSYDQNPSSNSSWLTISNNLYYNYGGGATDAQGNVISDGNPIFANPQISGWSYSIASGSAVFGSAMNFTPIIGGWGPTGFVIPQGGVTPSVA